MRTLMAAALLLAASPVFAADPKGEAEHIATAEKLAGSDLTAPLFLCKPASGSEVLRRATEGQSNWLEPVRLFDNLSYIGNSFVGSYVLETSAGLILFDSLNNTAEAETRLVPGLKKLGLDPAQIKYVIVTHGHFDHYGGAAYLQRTYGAKVALSAADWDLMARLPDNAPEINGAERPKRDVVIADGQKLTLGDTTLTLYITPGHTPGTLAGLVPVKDKGKPIVLSLMGGTAFPQHLEADEKTAGLKAYDASIQRLGRISNAAGAVGLLNTHAFANGSIDRMAAVHGKGDAGSFAIGKDAVDRYYRIIHECTAAAEARLK
jgi:metallo-beta-lactamase class B